MVARIGFFAALYTCLEIHVTSVAGQTLQRSCMDTIKSISKKRGSLVKKIPKLIACVVLLGLYVVAWGMMLINFFIEIGLVISIFYTILFGQEGDFQVTYYSIEAVRKLFEDYSGAVLPKMRALIRTRVVLLGKLLVILERYGSLPLAIGSVIYLVKKWKEYKRSEQPIFGSDWKDNFLATLQISLISVAIKLFFSALLSLPMLFVMMMYDWNEYKLNQQYKDTFNDEL